MTNIPQEWVDALEIEGDYATRLIFADWLEEHVEIELAAGWRWLVKRKLEPGVLNIGCISILNLELDSKHTSIVYIWLRKGSTCSFYERLRKMHKSSIATLSENMFKNITIYPIIGASVRDSRFKALDAVARAYAKTRFKASSKPVEAFR